MAIEVFNRVEKKYLINSEQFNILSQRLEPYMNLDEYCSNGEFYSINNLYFDTEEDELIGRSIEKPVYKEKLRLRSYGVPDSNTYVFLEIKKKYKGIVNKRRTTIKLTDAYSFIENGIIPENEMYLNTQVLKEIKYFLDFYRPKAKVFIKYDRLALFGKDDENLRITFDKNIITRRDNLRLENGENGEKILEDRMYLMEIKVPASFPLWLSDMLAELKIYSNSFSKYGNEYRKTMKNS
ncbi:MAG: polyphosphate polymerase domain-containing protein [Lachnospiraceae bacterium]|nr:polyphosphate polymerase domain-containing protein [Lachnospiraceae bacterium]